MVGVRHNRVELRESEDEWYVTVIHVSPDGWESIYLQESYGSETAAKIRYKTLKVEHARDS